MNQCFLPIWRAEDGPVASGAFHVCRQTGQLNDFLKMLSLKCQVVILLLVGRIMKRPSEEELRGEHSKDQKIQVRYVFFFFFFPLHELTYSKSHSPEQEAVLEGKEVQLPLLGSLEALFGLLLF